ncbi:type I polyketide synthase [Nocardia mexicana]|uniref:Acyl transferase domain-containing protein n=1 Tax=Nocardia mexicana TaxID=279262 RepID=A0A370GRV3_9NOCA|nr:type I polyketide synthase [Nocardia mexicana]RDI46438.1 acyl transferase domain-containing protein [Nocardia mexicana]
MADEAELREYLRRATRQLQQMRQRLDAERERTREPIAVVSMACRFPGGIGSPEQLWDALLEGRDLITDFPPDRGWDIEGIYDPDPDKFAKSYVREGGFLDGAGDFDAGFFGIGPREAEAMDPQQRLLLEVAWEAVERARLDPNMLRGSATGVFVGLSEQGYGFGATEAWDGAETYYFTGNSAAMAAGRIAYLLGLEGPAMTIDTACSSSLVALHQAVQSLRLGECETALAGGATVLSTPGPFALFSRQRALAPDGRCKSYAAGADGTAWGEGVGVVVLERLSDARRHGHPVLAVVRGSAVNADGASNGLTAPHGLAQQRVIRSALANAGVRADEVGMVEGHGTGTLLGDPVEAQALLATYGHSGGAGQLLLGSIKSNMGHTQSAAGVAGLIKAVQAIRHGEVPPTLHVDAPTPHAEWSAGRIRLALRRQPWPRTEHPRRAGVSSFGISGTNAHVVIEQAPETAEADQDSEPVCPIPWVVSAKNPGALRGQAARLRAACEAAPEKRTVDICHSLATTRSTFDHRAVVVAGTRAEMLDGLASVAAGLPASAVVGGRAGAHGRTAIMFPGQGGQRAGTGRRLLETYPVFARALDEICSHFDDRLEVPLRAVMFGPDHDPALIDRTGYTQPAIFAMEVALYRLLESWGVTADYVVGHSIGELAAAHVAGVMSLPDAATVVAARGRLMQGLAPGAMVSVRVSADEAAASIAERESAVSVAAANGPNATVISGDTAAVAEIARYWHARGRRVTRLRTDRAFHSPHMDPILDEFREVVSGVRLEEPRLPVISTLTGTESPPGQLTSVEHWVRQIRGTVRFHDGVGRLRESGVTTFLEAGPGDALSGLVYETVADIDAAAVPLLRPGADEALSVVKAVAAAWVRGAEVDWPQLYSGHPVRAVDLPTYAFQHRNYWIRADRTVLQGLLGDAGAELVGGGRTDSPEPVRPPEWRDTIPPGEREDSARRLVVSQIREILVELSDEDIDLDATVLEIGLTSLSVLELRSRINAAAGIGISLEDLFTHPTPRTLARLVATRIWSDTTEVVHA